MVNIELFLGKANNPSIGEWIRLPMKKDSLKDFLDTFNVNYGEYIISDSNLHEIEEALYLFIDEHSSVAEINSILQELSRLEEDTLKLHLGALAFFDGDYDTAKKLLQKGNYLFFKNVKTTEELGERIVEKRLLGYISNKIIVNGYIDYGKIGNDFECNGIHIYPNLKVAFGQVSEHSEYLK